MRKLLLALTLTLLTTAPAASIDVGGGVAGAASTAGGVASAAAGAAAGSATGAAANGAANAAGGLAGGAAGAAGAVGGAAGSIGNGAGSAVGGATGGLSGRGGEISNPGGSGHANEGRSSGGNRGGDNVGSLGSTGSVDRGLIDAPASAPFRSPATAPLADKEVILDPAGATELPRLPAVLLPLPTGSEPDQNTTVQIVPRLGPVQGSAAVLRALTRPLLPIASAPPQAVKACRETIQTAAKPHRAKQVEAVGAGPATRTSRGITTVPINARVIYARGRVSEVRQARISCRLNDRGLVVALR